MAIKWNDLSHKSSQTTRDQLRQEAAAELERIGFGKLRLARKLTQVALAERLNTTQFAISKMERRTDLLLSTLRTYIEGLGGELELRAIFPDSTFVIDRLTLNTPPQSKIAL